MSDPDQPGVEKLSTTKVSQAFLDKPAEELPSIIGGTGMLFFNSSWPSLQHTKLHHKTAQSYTAFK